MCSIIGFCGEGAAYSLFSECFARTVSRGPDCTDIVSCGAGYLLR